MKNNGRALFIATIIIFSHSLFAQENTKKLQQLLVDAYAAIEIHQPLDKLAWGDQVRELVNDKADPADPNTKGPDDFTAMHYAAAFGHLALIDDLYKLDPILLSLGTSSGATPLHAAAGEDQEKAISKLMKLGASRNAQSQTGATPLHVAARCNHARVIMALVQSGATRDATNANGHTPLHSATHNLSLTAMATLLQLGANPNARTAAGHKPLYFAARNRHLAAIVLLVAYGAKVPNDFIFLHNILGSCVRDLNFSRLQTVHERFEMLSSCAIEASDLQLTLAVLNAQSLHNDSYLHTAVRLGRGDLLQLVLAQLSRETIGQMIDLSNADGATPLTLALQNGQYAEADQLLDAGASPLLGNPSCLTLTHTLPSIRWLEELRKFGIVAIWRRVWQLKEILGADVLGHILRVMWQMHLPAYWAAQPRLEKSDGRHL